MATARAGYQSGFRNEFATEALPGALPVGRNSPQRCAYGLYAEQLTGSAFTAPRGANLRSWLYRIRPAAMHLPFEAMNAGRIVNDFAAVPPEMVVRLNKVLVDALNSTAVKARFQTLGLEALPGTPAKMMQYTQAERERWGKLIKANNIKLD